MSWFTAPTLPVPLIVTHWRFRSIHWLFLSICSLICTCASASKAPLNLNAYDPEVAALLEEYQAESDAFGSMLPSVLAYRGATKADTLVDFARGIISITAPDSASIRRAAVEIRDCRWEYTIPDLSNEHGVCRRRPFHSGGPKNVFASKMLDFTQIQ